MRHIQFGPIAEGAGDDAAVALVVQQAFAEDASLRQQVQLTPAQMARFWELQVALFHLAGEGPERSDVMTAREEGRYVAAAVVYQEGWKPRADDLARHLDAYRRAFGLRALARYLRFSAEFSLKSAPPGPCLRLQSLGCADGERGRGLGTAFLDFLHRDAGARKQPFVQLEVRTTNPARALYLRQGYEAAATITVCGVEMDVMRKKL
ncbi:MAG TPA: GNAT family N-acetyltransferase [Myxococcota bacterium]|jgi:GNAT superfamily N-acetyltransferase|nr:GNAT family N-acetyltransferase [Myxococcota bacterium]